MATPAASNGPVVPSGYSRSRNLPALEDVIENIGVGYAHVRILALGGSVWLADGAELLLIGAVTRSVGDAWHLGPGARGSLVSLVFIGVLLGNLLSGWLGDSLGRKTPIVASYLLVAVMSLGSACALGFWTLALGRIGVGFAFGIGQPSWGSLASELTPQGWRMAMNGSSCGLFIVGELYAAMLVYISDPQMQHLNWRWLLACGAIPSIILGVSAMFWLWESPSFLALHGKNEQVHAILDKMRWYNGKQEVSIDFKPPAQIQRTNAMEQMSRQMGVVFGKPLFYSTITISYSCFVLNFVMYGCLYSMPQVLPKVNMGVTPAMGLVVGCFWEVPGIILGICCGLAMTRKNAMLFYLVACIGALILFAFAAGLGEGAEVLFQAGYFGVKGFVACGFIVVYQYSTEIYPTEARTTGSAVCIAAGRVGSILCPLVFEQMQERLGSFEGFYYVMAVFCAINLVLVWFMKAGLENSKDADAYVSPSTTPAMAFKGKSLETDPLLAAVQAKI